MENAMTYGGTPMPGQNDSTYSPPASPPPQAVQVEVDDSKTTADYANFCRLTGAPEELLIDFGLNPQPTGVATRPIVVAQRVVTGWHMAKRLLQVLQLSVQRHETAFGVVETDIQKRVRPA